MRLAKGVDETIGETHHRRVRDDLLAALDDTIEHLCVHGHRESAEWLVERESLNPPTPTTWNGHGLRFGMCSRAWGP